MTHLREMFRGTVPQLVAGFAGTISAISDGMHFGWSAPSIPILQSEQTHIQITKDAESWLETTYLFGGIAGLPLTIYLVDKVGRRNSTMLSNCTSLISWILIATAQNLNCLYTARFLAGLASDVAFVATPMYMAEIADQKIRGFLSSIIYLMMLVGILLIYSVAPFTPFYFPPIIGSCLLLIQLVSFSFMPKSPYFLLSKGQITEARKSLNRLRVSDDNEEELEEIMNAVDRQRSEKGSLLDLLLIKSNRKALLIVGMLNVAQHFSGISVMLMNMHTILSEAHSLFFKTTTTAILFAFIMFVAASITSFTIDKYGRKRLVITSSILTGICLFVLAIYFNLQYVGYDLSKVSWIPVGCVMAYAAVFKIGLGMVPIVINSELFPNNVKAMGMTTADAMYLVFGLLSIEVYKRSSHFFGHHVPFYGFGCCAFATALFCWTVMPETKGKTLEEIQLLLKGASTVKSYNSISS